MGAVDAHRRRHVGERAVPVVVVEPGVAVHIVDEQVRIVVVVEVDPVGTLAEHDGSCSHTGPGGDVLERPVAAVVIQAVGLVFAEDEDVEPAVVVVVRPARRRGIDRTLQPRLLRDVAEFAVAVVPQQALWHRQGKPRAARDEQVHPAVVVVIGLDQVLAPQLLRQAGRLGSGPRRCRRRRCGSRPWVRWDRMS